jgi:hypothetical protein
MKQLAFVLLFMCGCSGEESGEASDQAPLTRCEQMRAHLVDLRLAGVVSIDKEAHREAHIAAMGSGFLAACDKLPEQAVTCALEASDSASVVACSSTGASQ